MKREHQIVIKLILLLCIAILVCTSCRKSEKAEAESDELTVTPTEIPKFEPKSAAELAQKTAEKLENLESVHMQLSANVNAKLDLLGTIMSGLGGIGSGESFVPDLDSILGKGDKQEQVAGVSTAVGNNDLRAAVCEPAGNRRIGRVLQVITGCRADVSPCSRFLRPPTQKVLCSRWRCFMMRI